MVESRKYLNDDDSESSSDEEFLSCYSKSMRDRHLKPHHEAKLQEDETPITLEEQKRQNEVVDRDNTRHQSLRGGLQKHAYEATFEEQV